MEIRGNCHCGRLRLALSWPADAALPARACGCSFCVPRGAVWTAHPRARLALAWDSGAAPSRYRFATGSADFLVCRACGAVPAAVSRIGGRDHAVVNLRHLDLPPGIEVEESRTDFGDEVPAARNARRRRGWIGQVVYEVAGDPAGTAAAGLVIETARPEDLPLVLGFIRELAEYERLAHEVVATPEVLAAALFGPDPAAEVLLARLGGEAVGFALFFHNFSTFLGRPGLYLEDLYVRPDRRGRGIGRALLARLAATAVARGCGRLEWAVLDWNEPAIAFYRGLGALPQDDWTVFRLSGAPLRTLAGETAARAGG